MDDATGDEGCSRGASNEEGLLFPEPARRWVGADAARVRVENGRAFGGAWLGMQAIERLKLVGLLERLNPP